MKRVTKKVFLLTDPCYSEKKLAPLLALFPDSGTTLRVVITRLLQAAVPASECWWEDPDKTLRLLACDFAERVPQSAVGKETIAVARRYAQGKATKEELAAAAATAAASASAASSAYAQITLIQKAIA